MAVVANIVLALTIVSAISFAREVAASDLSTKEPDLCQDLAKRFEAFVASGGTPTGDPMRDLVSMPTSPIRLGDQSAQFHELRDVIEALKHKYHAPNALLQATRKLEDSSWTIDRLGDASVYAVHAEGGTLDCNSFLFFSAQSNRPASLMDAPPIEIENICTPEQARLGQVGKTPAIIVVSQNDDGFDLEIAPFKDGKWGELCSTMIDNSK